MLISERRQQILSILHRDQFVTVEKLCGALYASPATIRRDLAEMARQGVLRRLRGGAEPTEGSNSDIPLLLRLQKDKEKKEKIAAIAARFLGGATTVFMDSSSTAYYLARRLKDCTGRSIVTCGLATMNYLNEQTTASVYCTGGRILHQSSFVGGHAVETVRAHHADVLFFSR